MNARVAFAVTALLLLSACVEGPGKFFSGPGHNDFGRQLSWPSEGEILSVQGFVIKNERDADNLQKKWKEIAAVMKNKPGFIEADLHPGAASSKLWMEISRWENIEALRAAVSDPGVQKLIKQLPDIRMSHIFVTSESRHID